MTVRTVMAKCFFPITLLKMAPYAPLKFLRFGKKTVTLHRKKEKFAPCIGIFA